MRHHGSGEVVGDKRRWREPCDGKVEIDRWHGISGKATVAEASANETVGAKIPEGSAATTLSFETLGNSTNFVERSQGSFDIWTSPLK